MPKLRPSPIPSRIVRSAGAVVWRPRKKAPKPAPGQCVDARDIEVLMVHRPRYDDWSWPKGKAELNEPLLVAGAREVEEETGVVVAMGAPLTTQRYRLGSGHTKEVHYWVGTVVDSGAVARGRAPVVPAPSKEIDKVRWVPALDARDMLTRRGDRRLLDELLSHATNGDLCTVTVALVRHGSAVSRSSWEGGEATRPLTRSGGRQSLVLADVLSALGVQRLLTSPWARCERTFIPYSAVTGLRLVRAEELTEAALEADSKSAQKVMKKLLRHPGGPIAVCSHRPVLPGLVKPLLKASSNQVRRDFPSDDPLLHPGQVLAAHVSFSGGEARVVAVQTHQPIIVGK
ncbi:MAG: NUDIX domain-containing protein [Actinomycetaceae bacterium]|nr:NUDIX domain-containing protein [Actinomycetaceae bacterium]